MEPTTVEEAVDIAAELNAMEAASHEPPGHALSAEWLADLASRCPLLDERSTLYCLAYPDSPPERAVVLVDGSEELSVRFDGRLWSLSSDPVDWEEIEDLAFDDEDGDLDDDDDQDLDA